MKAVLRKTPRGFDPANKETSEYWAKLRLGEFINADLKKQGQVRNPKFHRKYFALLNFGFENWEPPEQEFNGLPVEKNFDQFRHDIIAAAGFYTPVFNIKGEVRAEPDSISFAKMDSEKFEELYSKTIDVLLKYVLKNYTRNDVEVVIDKLMEFA